MNFDTTRGQQYGVEHLLCPKDGSIIDAITQQLDLGREKVEQLLDFGSIYLQGQRCLDNKQILQGNYIRVHKNPRRFPVTQFDFSKSLMFENDYLYLINKPNGLPVHPTVDNIHENLASLISQATSRETFVTHRLDVATSGLMIFAKSKTAQSEINSWFSDNKVRKLYRALVHGTDLPSGEIIHYMEPSPRAPKTVSQFAKLGWQICKLRIVEKTEVSEKHSEVIIELITGRTHQIRAQLSSMGFPIVGDLAYGSKTKLAEHEQICLQSCYLSFPDLHADNASNSSFRLQEIPWSNVSLF